MLQIDTFFKFLNWRLSNVILNNFIFHYYMHLTTKNFSYQIYMIHTRVICVKLKKNSSLTKWKIILHWKITYAFIKFSVKPLTIFWEEYYVKDVLDRYIRGRWGDVAKLSFTQQTNNIYCSFSHNARYITVEKLPRFYSQSWRSVCILQRA